MSSRYKVHDYQLPYFVTSTVVAWVDALSREQYKKIICDSLRFCVAQKGLILHAWVIMPNHLHLIISCSGTAKIPDVMRDFKKYTSRKIVNEIIENAQEGRKEWMLNMFRFAANTNRGAEDYQFWQHNYHPIALDSQEKANQKLTYLHENPVRAGIVLRAEDYKYSSAADYLSGTSSILPITWLY